MNDKTVPERKTLLNTVLVALDGSLKSYVACYLQKIQKANVSAVSISLTSERSKGLNNSIKCRVDEAKLKEISKFCEKLSIPLTIIRSTDEFDELTDCYWVPEKIQLESFEICQQCHSLRMKMIYEVAKKFNCQKIVTGHMAKVFSSTKDGHLSYFIHAANDLKFDQSEKLISLPQEILSLLSLPLGDLKYEEVLKMAENFNIEELVDTENICLTMSESTSEALKELIPSSLVKSGQVHQVGSTSRLTKFESQLEFELGKPFRFQAGTNSKNTSHYFVEKFDYPENVLVAKEGQLKFAEFSMFNCYFVANLSKKFPLRGYIYINDSFVAAHLYFKTLDTAFVKLDQSEIELRSGQKLKIFAKKSQNSRILLSAQVDMSATLREMAEKKDEEEERPQSITF